MATPNSATMPPRTAAAQGASSPSRSQPEVAITLNQDTSTSLRRNVGCRSCARQWTIGLAEGRRKRGGTDHGYRSHLPDSAAGRQGAGGEMVRETPGEPLRERVVQRESIRGLTTGMAAAEE